VKLDPYLGDVRFEMAFTTLPDDPNPAFVDLTDSVVASAGISIMRGRADEFAQVQPGTCALTLDNTAGWFTAGFNGSPYYPNVKIRRKGRVTFRPAGVTWNLLSPNAASMETDVSAWTAAGSVPPTLSWDTTHPADGTHSLLITWGTGGSFPLARTPLSNLVIGRVYTAAAQVWVPVGSPNPLLVIAGVGLGSSTGTKGALATISFTFTATAPVMSLQVWPASAPTAGQQCWVDSVIVDEGTAVPTFTTTQPPAWSFRFTGYAEELPTTWPDGGAYSEVQVSFTDRFKRIGRLNNFRSIIEQEFLSDSPFAYYTLAEPSTSTTVGDTSKNGRAPLPVAQFGSGGTFALGNGTGPAFDGLTALQLASVNNTNGMYFGGPFNTQSSLVAVGQSLEAIFLTSSATAQDIAAIDYSNQFAAAPGNQCVLRLSVTAAGKLQGLALNGTAIVSTTTVSDGLTHHAAIVQTLSGTTVTDTLYLDGVLVGSTTWTSSIGLLPRYDRVFVGGGVRSDSKVFTGTLSHVACYDAGLAAGRVSDHAFAALQGLVGERTDQRIARYARWAGVPAAETSLGVGLSASVSYADTTGKSPLLAMQDMEATENGVLFMAGNGQLTFQPRTYRYNAASLMTISGEDLDPSSRFVENDAYVLNDATVSRPNGITFRAVNVGSSNEIGPAATAPTIFVTTDNEVIDAANWKANQNAVPTPRMPNLTVDLLTHPAIATQIMQLEISAQVTVSPLPAVAPASSIDLFVEGYTETINDSGWVWAANTSPALNGAVWQLDSSTYSVLDVTTRLAY
jgi:hypothetical protein